MTLTEQILPQLQSLQHVKRWVVAFSGGLDSTVLAHCLSQLIAGGRLSQPLQLIHINHQLSPNAQQWQAHCEAQARELQANMVTVSVTVDNAGFGLEAAARSARYQAFRDYLQPGDCLVLGHHQQDQAETLLLRLLRGAGVRGLAAMPAHRMLDGSELLRPLLGVDRGELERYAREHLLNWVEDESNLSPVFDRNYLRHEILPRLAKRWPQASKQLSKTAALMRDADTLLMDLAQLDLDSLDERDARWGHSIDCKKLLVLGHARQNNLLRFWLSKHHLPLPEQSHLQQLKQQLLSSSPGTAATVSWPGVEARYFDHRLYVAPPLPEFSLTSSCRWQAGTELALESNHLSMEPVAAGGLQLPSGFCEVRWRQGGERCCPDGRSHSQVLKKLLQEYRLETWLRDRVPCIYVDEHLAAVGDLWVCQGFVAPPGQQGYRLSWKICP